MDQNDRIRILVWIYIFLIRTIICMWCLYLAYRLRFRGSRHRLHNNPRSWSVIGKIPEQAKYLRRLLDDDNKACLGNLRMDRNAFMRLCYLLQNVGGLHDEKYVSVSEMVAMFLSVLAHHKKNIIVRHDFRRSGQTVSHYFRKTLRAVLRISQLLLVHPKPIDDTCTSDTWSWFKGCLGALDGTYIDVRVRQVDKARYRSRKGDVSVNVLGVCDPNLNFIYVLAGWEGSAAVSRVLRDALTKPHGLRVPSGNYYLCDAGYMNCDGFLTPYRGTRYHLSEWHPGTLAPQNPREYFNMKHCKARNVIERAFGLLKIRWAVLRSTTFYPIKVQNMIILACALLHNYIRIQMPVDPLDETVDENNMGGHEEVDEELINTIGTSTQWTAFRDDLAEQMYNAWRGNRNN